LNSALSTLNVPDSSHYQESMPLACIFCSQKLLLLTTKVSFVSPGQPWHSWGVFWVKPSLLSLVPMWPSGCRQALLGKDQVGEDPTATLLSNHRRII
jgi:hypothetical protein